jgi:hypothetical protein
MILVSSLSYEINPKFNQKDMLVPLIGCVEKVRFNTTKSGRFACLLKRRDKGEYIFLSMACAAPLNDKKTKALASLLSTMADLTICCS